MFEELIYIAVACASSCLVSVLLGKYFVSDKRIMEKVDLILDDMVNDVEMQKKVYMLGALLGSGIAKGSGLQPSVGKFKLQDVIAQAAAGFIGNMFKGPVQEVQKAVGEM